MTIHRIALFGSEVPEEHLHYIEGMVGRIRPYWEIVVGGQPSNVQEEVQKLALRLGRTTKIFPIDKELEKSSSIVAMRTCNSLIANYSDWGIAIWNIKDNPTKDLIRRFVINGKNIHTKILTEGNELVDLEMEDKLKLLDIRRRFVFP